ncbi:hypothetical protein Syun_003495 [Stephania yunnanensis]|uniref:Uncharacterized protein n=1 Tax=Stephania yunnanensis TaxID=152371 RepID=A0AAP0Q099_9MAGN
MMLPSGPQGPVGGAQGVSPSLLRSNSSILRGQGVGIASQSTFSSVVSPHTQYNGMNLLGNVANVSSLLNQSLGNGGSSSGLSGSRNLQCGGIDQGAESDPMSTMGNGMGFNPSSQSFAPTNTTNPTSSSQSQGQQFLTDSGNQLVHDQQQHRLIDHQNFPHGQFAVSQNHSQHQQQYQAIQSGFGNVGPAKLEPQTAGDQKEQLLQQLHASRNPSQIKLEPQHIQNLTNLMSVKMEPQHLDQSYFLQQQQQQQLLQLSRQSSQAAAAAAQMNILQQQRLLQFQQQQQLLKGLPQQRPQLLPQYQQHNSPIRTAMKSGYESGICARRLMQYMYHQQQRPADNNIDFWRKFVAEYYAPHAKRRWCLSLYGSGRQTTGVFPQVLPRLCKIKYDSGTLEELLYIDMPREFQNASGQIVLEYTKAVQESVFEHLRVVREGQLRIVFSLDLKVGQLGAVAQKYQAATQSGTSSLSAQELQSNCNMHQVLYCLSQYFPIPKLALNAMFVASARQLAKALEVPLVNDLGYTKRYVRCLQSPPLPCLAYYLSPEVVNSMKDLVDYSQKTGNGPMWQGKSLGFLVMNGGIGRELWWNDSSLINFPKRTSGSQGLHLQGQPGEPQQSVDHSMNNDQNSAQASSMQLTAGNGVVSANNSINTSTITSAGAVVGLLGQNSTNTRQEALTNGANNLYGGSTVQIPSAGSSTSLPHAQPIPSSPFPSPTPSISNNQPHGSRNASPVATTSLMSSVNSPVNISQQPAHSNDADMNDTQSSVHKIIQEMMSSQMNGAVCMTGGGSSGNGLRSINGVSRPGSMVLNGGNGFVGNGRMNNSGLDGMEFRNMGNGFGLSTTVGGVRVGNGSVSMIIERPGAPPMMHDPSMNHPQQHGVGNGMVNGLGPGNIFNRGQFDWKPSP